MRNWLPQGFTKTPWGCKMTSNGLVGVVSVKDRNQRIELGEFAIQLFDKMGINAERLQEAALSLDPFNGLQFTPPQGRIPAMVEKKTCPSVEPEVK
jgi:hypothetical protein